MSLRRFDGDEPSERHDHFDADGNPTGHTIITREPEWDARTRAEAIASVLAEWRRCGRCGTSGLVDDQEPLQIGGAIAWTWHDGRQVEVTAYRCLGCAAMDMAERDFDRIHEKHKPVARMYSPGDGVKWRLEVIQGEPRSDPA